MIKVRLLLEINLLEEVEGGDLGNLLEGEEVEEEGLELVKMVHQMDLCLGLVAFFQEACHSSKRHPMACPRGEFVKKLVLVKVVPAGG